MRDYLDEILKYEMETSTHRPGCLCPNCCAGKSNPARRTLLDEILNEAGKLNPEASPCPVNKPGKATTWCKNPGTVSCPPVPNLLCMRSVNGIPLEYNDPNVCSFQYFDQQTKLVRTKKTLPNHLSMFIPVTRNAIIKFTQDMARYGMPIKSLITGGSYNCRCVSGTDNLTNHARGEAFDLVGVRWKSPHPFSRVEDTIVTPYNLCDPEQRRLLQRIDACLRLCFNQVLDYQRLTNHQDHFHCDMNNGGPYRVYPSSTIRFVQESLNLAFGRPIVQITGELDTQTIQALSEFSPEDSATLKTKTLTTLQKVYKKLFAKIASGNFSRQQVAPCMKRIVPVCDDGKRWRVMPNFA